MPWFSEALIWLLIWPCLAMQVIFCLEIALGLVRGKATAGSEECVSICVLIPAHNESAVILRTLTSISDGVGPKARILVVADNCNDDTAQIARDYGVEVIERLDTNRRGKGYALAFGIDHLSLLPPDVLVILDADCRPQAGAVAILAERALRSQRPVQGRYLLDVVDGAGPRTRISAFAFLVKNWVRQSGMQRIADTCVLTGSGMAFPWQQISAMDLANGEAVEDLVLGLKLALAGHVPCFEAKALIVSETAPSDAETGKQRRRWETGFIAVALAYSAKMFLHGLGKKDARTIWLAFHLTVPPLMLLLLFSTGGTLLALAGTLFLDISAQPAMAAIFALVTTVTLVALIWFKLGRSMVRARDFLLLPAYTAAKFINLARALTNQNRAWEKTDRE